MFSRLQEPEVVPYDLVVFDESHKLAADREADLRLRKTDRYRLAEALAGVFSWGGGGGVGWGWPHFFFLPPAAPMGEGFLFFCFLGLVLPSGLAAIDGFYAFPLG